MKKVNLRINYIDNEMMKLMDEEDLDQFILAEEMDLSLPINRSLNWNSRWTSYQYHFWCGDLAIGGVFFFYKKFQEKKAQKEQ